MSTVMNKGFKMHCKLVMENMLKLVGLLVGTITAIAKPKGYLEASIYIRQYHIKSTSIIIVVYTSLYSSFFLSV